MPENERNSLSVALSVFSLLVASCSVAYAGGDFKRTLVALHVKCTDQKDNIERSKNMQTARDRYKIMLNFGC